MQPGNPAQSSAGGEKVKKVMKEVRFWYENLLDDQKLSLFYTIIATITLVLDILIAVKLHNG